MYLFVTRTKTEIATGAVTEYFWDYRNRLVKVEERSAGGILLKTIDYAYDPLGRRIAQVVNGVTSLRTVYDGDHAWADYKADGTVAANYLVGDKIDELLARSVPAQGAAFYLADKLGTIRDLVIAGGVVVNTIDYSSFGQILGQTNAAMGDRFTFTGREWDSTGEQFYYRARTFNPYTGRFVTVDPVGFDALDMNLYRYVGNQPTQFTDPTGKYVLGLFAFSLATAAFAFLPAATCGIRESDRGISSGTKAVKVTFYSTLIATPFIELALGISVVSVPAVIAAAATASVAQAVSVFVC